MNITFGFVVVSGGLTGIISFSCLALAIATEYWYIIEDKRANHTDPARSNSGLWGVTDGMANIFLLRLFEQLSINSDRSPILFLNRCIGNILGIYWCVGH